MVARTITALLGGIDNGLGVLMAYRALAFIAALISGISTWRSMVNAPPEKRRQHVIRTLLTFAYTGTYRWLRNRSNINGGTWRHPPAPNFAARGTGILLAALFLPLGVMSLFMGLVGLLGALGLLQKGSPLARWFQRA